MAISRWHFMLHNGHNGPFDYLVDVFMGNEWDMDFDGVRWRHNGLDELGFSMEIPGPSMFS